MRGVIDEFDNQNIAPSQESQQQTTDRPKIIIDIESEATHRQPPEEAFMIVLSLLQSFAPKTLDNGEREGGIDVRVVCKRIRSR